MNKNILRIGAAAGSFAALTIGAWVGCAATTPAPVRTASAPSPQRVEVEGASGELRVTRIAHASVVIEAGDHRLLTDPWFTEAPGYHQGEPLGMDVRSLPPLTAIVSSHDHYDHFDVESLRDYPNKSVPFVVRRGSGEKAREVGFTDVRELDHWQSTEVNGIKITATPAAHGVAENSYVFEMADFTIFFGGDTKKIPELEQIPARFPRIDLALLAVNGLTVTGVGQVVMNPEEAAEVLALLKAKVAIPTHYRFHGSWLTDTFLLRYNGTPERFVAAASKVPGARAVVLEPGDPLVLDRQPAP